jgi:hypothetical protein
LNHHHEDNAAAACAHRGVRDVAVGFADKAVEGLAPLPLLHLNNPSRDELRERERERWLRERDG